MGSNCNVSKSDGIVNLNEDIQINIQTDSAITIELNDKVPKIIVQNYGPTINLTNEVVQRLKTDGEWDNFIKVRKYRKQFFSFILFKKTRTVCFLLKANNAEKVFFFHEPISTLGNFVNKKVGN